MVDMVSWCLLYAVTVVTLQEAERESIELQEQLNGLQEEKERLLNSLVEAEYVSQICHRHETIGGS